MTYPRAALVFPVLGLLLALGAGTALPARAQSATRVEDLAVDPRADDGSSTPAGFFNAGGKLFFNAFEKRTGQELYVTDGTATGTELLGDLCPGVCGSYASPLAEVGGTLLFLASTGDPASSGLWRSDGTEVGTYPLTDGDGKPLQLSAPVPASFASLGGCLYFTAYGNGAQTAWRTDGTQAGTVALPSLVPALPAEISSCRVVAGKLYLFASPPYPAPTVDCASGGEVSRDSHFRHCKQVLLCAGGSA